MKNSVAGCLCVLHLIFLEVSRGEVTGSLGDTLTLPCTYTDKYQYEMCWGRGECSLFGCNDYIIQTDGHKVTRRKSDRYQLLGNISRGDVSLTITGATNQDEGTYCCRVEIHGWGNDQKGKVIVKIQEEKSKYNVMSPKNPVSTSETTSPETHFTITVQPMDDTDNVTYSRVTTPIWRTSVMSQESGSPKQSLSKSTVGNVIPAVCGALFLVAVMGVIIYVYKFQSEKTTKAESTTSVINMEALAEPRSEAAENIYI